MRKFILTVGIMLLAFASASAQDNMNLPGFHDISLSAGYGSNMQFFDSYKKIISRVRIQGFK